MKIWGTEFAYSTSNATEGVSARPKQARLLRLSIDLWQQQSYAGPLFHFTYRDMGTDPTANAENFGLVKRDFTPKHGLVAVRQELIGQASNQAQSRNGPRNEAGAVSRPARGRVDRVGRHGRGAARARRRSLTSGRPQAQP